MRVIVRLVAGVTIVLVLGLAALELSWSRSAQRRSPAPAATLFTGAMEPELPATAEVSAGEPAALPSFSR
jgi:hypothetical protein